MKKTHFFMTLFIMTGIILSLLSPCASAVSDPDIQAKSALLVEVNSGKVLYQKDKDDRVAPASLTKVMTVLLCVEAIESGKVNESDMVTASAKSSYNLSYDSSTENIKPGETMSLKDLMYCALLPSANEACNIIAEHVGGSIESFVDMMNAKAGELGCSGTHYANANGLTEEGHYTTAWDQYLILQEAMKHPTFAEITKTYTYTTAATNMSGPRILKNTNTLLNDKSSTYYKYCTGGKTGSTVEAGYCLVSEAKENDMTLISVVMGAKSTVVSTGQTQIQSFPETKRLFEWGFTNYTWKDIVLSSDLVTKVDVAYGKTSYVNLNPVSTIRAVVSKDFKNDDVTRDIQIYPQPNKEKLRAPVNAGDVLGEMTVSVDGEKVGTVKLVANTGVELARFAFIRGQIWKALTSIWMKIILLIILLAFGGYCVLVIRYNKAVRKKRSRKTVRQGNPPETNRRDDRK